MVILTRGNRVVVVGRDLDTGYAGIRRLRPNRRGQVIWKKPGGAKCALILDSGFAGQDEKGRTVYEADISAGQGRLMKPQRSGEYLRMDGYRLAAADVGHTVRTVNQTAMADLDKLVMIAGIVLVVVTFVFVGGIAWMIKMLNNQGMA